MATGIAVSTFSGPTHLKKCEAWSAKSSSFVRTPVLTNQKKLIHCRTNKNFSIRAQYSDKRGGSGGDFVAGFLLGGAIFGALGYVFAPQIKMAILDENEHGFRKARGPMYYEEDNPLERTRDTLNAKLHQLGSAIDNVSARLRGPNYRPPVPLEAHAGDDEYGVY